MLLLLPVAAKAIAIKSWKMAMNGKVTSSKLLRPKESISHIAGSAKRKLMMPKPIEAIRALPILNPALSKTDVL